MKKLALALFLVCCFGSTYLYAAEYQTNAVAEQQDTVSYQPYKTENQQTRKFASGIFSIGGGGFFPGGDLDNFDTGYNGTFSAGVTLGSMIGLGIDISYRENEVKKQYHYDNKLSTVALDYLLYFQPNYWRVQPYLAVGFGLYFNHLDTWKGMELSQNEGSAYGIVGKAGIRFFITENLFIGAYGKYFTNWQGIKYYYYNGYSVYEKDETYNLGGLIGNVELGLKF